MAEFVIRDAEGKKVRTETTVDDSIAPTLMQGETAELVVEKPPKPAKSKDTPAADA